MDKPFLLTYQDEKHPYGTFSWFETEEEMNEFAENNEVHVIEGMHILGAEVIL